MNSTSTSNPAPAQSPLAAALARLNDALDGLDVAIGESTATAGNVDAQVQRMADDRARLAQELDATEARAQALRDVNADVSKRLVSAMEMVRDAMDKG